MKQINRQSIELCEAVRKCDDTLGRYSDHEGEESGPTWHFWEMGFTKFDAHCDRAIRDHQKTIKVWRKFKRLNEQRKG